LFYTNGLEVFCNDDKLNETLYVNRAACNLHFGKDDEILYSQGNIFFFFFFFFNNMLPSTCEKLLCVFYLRYILLTVD
jgi:hypothetical protein